MNFAATLCIATLTLTIGSVQLSTASTSKPNVVIYISDDHGRSDSEPYGSPDARTPMMASLANQGLTFDRAYVASPACGPNRTALLTGLMPARNGAEGNHMKPHEGTFTMVSKLQAVGYDVASFGKISHWRNNDVIGFDSYGPVPNSLSEQVQEFFAKRVSNKPLCLFVGDRRPHTVWTKNKVYDPTNVILPDNVIDTPEAREHWARYLSDVTGMDEEMRRVDEQAKAYFGSDDFIFIYTSDHGSAWPFGKWNLYEQGIAVPFIARWPGKTKPATRTQAMVSWVDIFPTLIDLAGGPLPKNVDGISFAHLLKDRGQSHRDHIFTTHTGDTTMNVFPIRSVQDKRYKYLRNTHSDFYHSTHSDVLRFDGSGGYWDSWDKAAQTDPKAATFIKRYYQRPPEELYDLVNDPGEKTNLAQNPEYQPQLQRLSQKLDTWMATQGDTVRLTYAPYPLSGDIPHKVAIRSTPYQRRKK